MKKFFTLISLVCFAMGVNAQDKYEAVKIVANGEGGESYQIADEFKAVVDEDGKTVKAANVTDNKCIIVIETANVKCEAVASGAVAKSGEGDAISAEGVVASWNPIEFQANKNRIVTDAEGNITRSLNIGSTGIAYTKIMAVQASKDGNIIPDTYKADYEYYEPDGSKGLPVSGLYYKFTPKVAGTFKVGIWTPKDNRPTYLVEESSKLPVAFTAEGFVNSNDYSTPEQVQAKHAEKFVNAETGEDSNPYVIGNGNQFWGWINFSAEAGKTYWLFSKNGQVGFGGYEFTAGSAGINDITTDVDKNAPKYNLAGQRVDKNYKGVVIQNGKKYMNK